MSNTNTISNRDLDMNQISDNCEEKMLNIELIHQIDDISIELRKILKLPTELVEFDNFSPITYDDLSQKIMNEFQGINIVDDVSSDYSYMIKLNDEIEIQNRKVKFIIHIGTEMSAEDRLESLMHEMAHYILHSDNLKPATPIGKYRGSPVQEKEANCLSRAFLIPRPYFLKALTIYSRNDGSVDIREMASYFKVQESLIIERGRDLMIWN